MGLTRRQAETIQRMIIEESRAAYASQQERHRILNEVDDENEGPVLESRTRELPPALRHAIVDLVESFYHNNLVYEGVEFDRGLAAKRATEYLFHLIESDVKETVDMLQSGDFEDLDEDDVELPPMHPRGSGKPGGVTGGGGGPEIGKPSPTGMRSTLPEPKRGYPGAGEEDVTLPPMHPRGRK